MLKIDQHISSLLYFHDCVIIPNFGGFVANYTSATVHPTQHVFTAPSKKIGFNINLKNNDGLLANQMASAAQITFGEANKIIENCVQHYLRELALGNRLAIENVGTLFYDIEKKLQFEPAKEVNHLPSAFGLTNLQSPAIKRDGHVERIGKEFKNRIPVVSENPKRKINIRKFVALALLVPAIISLVWIPYKTQVFKNINYSSLNPLTPKEASSYIKRDGGFNEEIFSEKVQNGFSVPDTGLFTTIQLSEQATNFIPVKIEREPTTQQIQIVEAETTNVVTPEPVRATNGNFHVIAGCFKVFKNAQNFVAQLKAKNFEAKIIGTNKDGLHMVSIGDYSAKEQAFAQMNTAHDSDQAVWLWEN